jgi:hypothetical protein
MDLTESETKIIEQHRQEQAEQEHKDALIEKAFKVAYEFDQWSRSSDEGLTLTFSTFINN